ncbi:MAG TPA: hypothetical protein PLV76_08130, partial [Spirochaetales bacterium]|nr:hypothetical protein [Spirochaetales bacterium]
THYPFSDPLLCKKFVFWYGNTTNIANFFWDKDGNGSLSNGDYNTMDIPAGQFPMYGSYVLSPLMTY